MRSFALSTLVLSALLAPPPAHAAPPGCSLPGRLDGRRFTNLTDPYYRPDNPNAGRMVRVDFSANRYLLTVLGTRLRVQGTYRYARLAPNIAVVDMEEAFEGGDTRYQLVLTCLTDHEGHFIYTQSEGPVPPQRRQNSGRWTLQPR